MDLGKIITYISWANYSAANIQLSPRGCHNRDISVDIQVFSRSLERYGWIHSYFNRICQVPDDLNHTIRAFRIHIEKGTSPIWCEVGNVRWIPSNSPETMPGSYIIPFLHLFSPAGDRNSSFLHLHLLPYHPRSPYYLWTTLKHLQHTWYWPLFEPFGTTIISPKWSPSDMSHITSLLQMAHQCIPATFGAHLLSYILAICDEPSETDGLVQNVAAVLDFGYLHPIVHTYISCVVKRNESYFNTSQIFLHVGPWTKVLTP